MHTFYCLCMSDDFQNTGCPETLVLDMSKLVWSVLAVVKQKDPLSSEVITWYNLSFYILNIFRHVGEDCILSILRYIRVDCHTNDLYFEYDHISIGFWVYRRKFLLPWIKEFVFFLNLKFLLIGIKLHFFWW